MHQTKKVSAEEAERGEKVRRVLLAAGKPLGPVEIAERINESWCMWGGTGMGSAVTPVLRKIGARISKGKWSLKAVEPTGDIGPTGSMDLMPHHVMPVDSWKRIKEGLKQQA